MQHVGIVLSSQFPSLDVMQKKLGERHESLDSNYSEISGFGSASKIRATNIKTKERRSTLLPIVQPLESQCLCLEAKSLHFEREEVSLLFSGAIWQ